MSSSAIIALGRRRHRPMYQSTRRRDELYRTEQTGRRSRRPSPQFLARRRRREQHDPPLVVTAMMEHCLQVTGGAACIGEVRFVHDQLFGDPRDAGLDRLHVVAEPGRQTPSLTSVMPATATSDCPVPTVSTMTRSTPTTASRSITSPVLRVTPPR